MDKSEVFPNDNLELGDKKKESNSSSKGLTVVGIILCVILIPVLIVNLVLIFKGYTFEKDELPNMGGYYPLMVQSGSMSGTIEVGDLIIVHIVNDSTIIKENDIITFWDGEPGGTLVTHRVTEVIHDNDGNIAYRTKGDANIIEDAKLITRDKVVGMYQKRVPKLGDVALFMQTIPGLAVCVFLPLVLFILYDVISRSRIEKNEKKETAELLEELEKLRQEKAARTEGKKDGSGGE